MARGGLTAEHLPPLASAIAANSSLTSCNVLQNGFDVATANSLVKAVKDKDISLCGIKPDQTEVTFYNEDLQPADAVLLASDLSKPVVTGSLTKIE